MESTMDAPRRHKHSSTPSAPPNTGAHPPSLSLELSLSLPFIVYGVAERPYFTVSAGEALAFGDVPVNGRVDARLCPVRGRWRVGRR